MYGRSSGACRRAWVVRYPRRMHFAYPAYFGLRDIGRRAGKPSAPAATRHLRKIDASSDSTALISSMVPSGM